MSEPERPKSDVEKADEVTRGVARFVEAGRNRIEDRAERGRRDRHRMAPADQRAHRCKQHRIAPDLLRTAGSTERIEPADFRPQRENMAEDEQDTDDQNAENEAVQPRIAHEGRMRLPEQDGRSEADDDQEENHDPEEGHGARQLVRIVVSRFGLTSPTRQRQLCHMFLSPLSSCGGD